MNLAYIVIDTLRYDYIGANGNDWIETPNIDRFASKALAFDYAFCASFPTIPYRTDVITGQYGAPIHPWKPLRHERQNLAVDHSQETATRHNSSTIHRTSSTVGITSTGPSTPGHSFAGRK